MATKGNSVKYPVAPGEWVYSIRELRYISSLNKESVGELLADLYVRQYILIAENWAKENNKSECTLLFFVPKEDDNSDWDNVKFSAIEEGCEVRERLYKKGLFFPIPDSQQKTEEAQDKDILGLLEQLFPAKIEEGVIAYSKAVRIAFDTTTPDNIANQFAEVLSDAKECADIAGQPVTLFAQFQVTASGELSFDCPTEYKSNINKWEMQALIRDKYNVVSYKGKYVSQMNREEEIRSLLKQVRAGNFEGCKMK